MKTRIFAILLALVLFCTVLPWAAIPASAATYSGSCGSNLTWTLDTGTGVLSINGSGRMTDWKYGTAPWYQYAESIKTISIASGVTYIGDYAFLFAFNVTSVTIPEGVKGIGSSAFCYCMGLKSLTIPNSVTSIGTYAFEFCRDLSSLTLPNQLKTLKKGVLFNCISLKGLTLPSTVTTIEDSALSGCESLTSLTIPSGVTSIGQSAFYSCSGLKTISIPASVTTIGRTAFGNCASLTKITVDSGNQNYSSDQKGVLFNKNKTTLLRCPGGFQGSYTIPNGVTEVSAGAFSSCKGLTGVVIPNGVTAVRDSMFYECSGLTSVTIPDGVTTIENHAFFWCSSLKEIALPKNLTSMGQNAFRGCINLKSVSLPDGITKIEMDAFLQCSSLNSVVIPPSVTTLGEHAFGFNMNSYAELKPGFVIYGIPGSEAQAYANRSGVTFKALEAPKITKHPASASANIGQSATFQVSASGMELHYQWQYKKNGATAWTDWAGKTETSVSVTASQNNAGCQYRCVVSNYAGSVPSNPATLSVPDAVSAPKITTQPKSATVKLGESTTFKVAASGENLKYQWQYQKVGETGWTNYYGGTTASITVKGSKTNNGCKYHCVVSNAGGSVTSNAAVLTVITVATPVITSQPQSTTVGLGAKTAFRVVADGENLTYKWQYQKVEETGWTDYYGGTTDTIVVKGSRTNGGCKYRCVVSNEGGTVTSEAAVLTVDLDHTCPGAEFTDMPSYGTPEHEAIDWAIETGLTTGTSATTFSPDKTVTRGQAVTFLWRACGSPEPETTENPFTDVKTNSYCYKAVLWAVENDITKGTSATKFSPNKTCSRGNILTFLYRQQGSPEVDESVTVPYTDIKAGAYYEAAMKWAYANGIDRGVSATKFAPGADCTRASTVLFLYRAIAGDGRLD